MSGREWKPGDVARTAKGGTVARTARNSWVLLDDGHSIVMEDADLRPLIVIDPESPEQIGRLAKAWHEAEYADLGDVSMTLPQYRLQAALREFVNPTPPRPDEPTGLGAVVEDADGRIYTRYETHGPKHEPQPWWQSANGPEADVVRRFAWSDIAAVRVLSEGVRDE